MSTASGKRFRLSASDIRPLAEGRGAGIASDHIMVDGRPVGFMYREAPDDPHDSGWRFLSGAESQEYLGKSENFALYDVNTIVDYIDAPVGCAFGRNEHGDFVEEAMPDHLDA
jgi:hypothetical protein